MEKVPDSIGNKTGIEGYTVAKTCNYFRRDYKFPVSKRKTFSSQSKIRAKEPGPTTYNEPYEKLHKRLWKKPNGKFLKAKKLTIIDEAKKKGRLTPGPGEYLKLESKSPKTKSKKRQNGFGIGDRITYLSTIEFYSEETPCSWNYTPRSVSSIKTTRWRKPRPSKQENKDEMGPGKYEDGVKKGLKLVMNNSISHAFSRSNSPSVIMKRAEDTKNVPAVGSYKNLDCVYKSERIYRNDRSVIILPYKHKGFAYDEIQRSKDTPGPGAYNIGPPARIY